MCRFRSKPLVRQKTFQPLGRPRTHRVLVSDQSLVMGGSLVRARSSAHFLMDGASGRSPCCADDVARVANFYWHPPVCILARGKARGRRHYCVSRQGDARSRSWARRRECSAIPGVWLGKRTAQYEARLLRHSLPSRSSGPSRLLPARRRVDPQRGVCQPLFRSGVVRGLANPQARKWVPTGA
jgi:hypothetical protein